MPEVLQGHTFADNSERDVFFLREIHKRYSEHWPELLEANISLEEYILSPVKMLQFVNELGIAMAGRDDSVAAAKLALVVSDGRFFTNADAYHPEILRAVAQTLMKLGPNGCGALAASFSESHYRDDSESLEELAKTIGEERPADPGLVKALADTAFNFSTTGGGSYPRCTTEAVKNLLCLPEGAAEVRTHLTTNEIFGDPVRFQAVLDGMESKRVAGLLTNLTAIEAEVRAKLVILTNHPGGYRTALEGLDEQMRRKIEAPGESKQGPH
ncbi:MAG TPA: hypothetical protein VH597_15155 [Verrucomicrobiae bacterium]|nr:hypothetical protein [Verrucomicrobiae bacterium]